MQIQYMVT